MINFGVEIEVEIARVVNWSCLSVFILNYLYLFIGFSMHLQLHVLTFLTYPYFTWSYFCV